MKFQEVDCAGLKAIMARYGHTQATLAELLGVSKSFVCNRFNHNVDWTLPEMRKVSEIYEMPMDELFN